MPKPEPATPPTLSGGNIDITLLGVKSTFYLPVFAEGALFFVGDPHHAMGNGEVALTAMEGSVRDTFRLTVCQAGAKDAPSVAYHYPFGPPAESAGGPSLVAGTSRLRYGV